MSALTDFAAHARKMVAAEHKPECPSLRRARWHEWTPGVGHAETPTCPGCNPQRDRDLFARLADEIDAYLHRDEVVDLFGDVAMEPEGEPA